jgi:hypothetical protein
MNALTSIEAGIPCPIFIRKVKNHTQIKEDILKNIQLMGKFSIVQTSSLYKRCQKISHTDYHMSSAQFRPYFPIIEPILREHHNLLTQSLNISVEVILSNFWFQQYETGDYHGMHVHDTPFSSVYYVDLPTGSAKTTLTLFGKEYEIPVEEGDILTFPGFIPHESKENKSATKTVVVFNSTYEERQ